MRKLSIGIINLCLVQSNNGQTSLFDSPYERIIAINRCSRDSFFGRISTSKVTILRSYNLGCIDIGINRVCNSISSYASNLTISIQSGYLVRNREVVSLVNLASIITSLDTCSLSQGLTSIGNGVSSIANLTIIGGEFRIQ